MQYTPMRPDRRNSCGDIDPERLDNTGIHAGQPCKLSSIESLRIRRLYKHVGMAGFDATLVVDLGHPSLYLGRLRHSNLQEAALGDLTRYRIPAPKVGKEKVMRDAGQSTVAHRD